MEKKEQTKVKTNVLLDIRLDEDGEGTVKTQYGGTVSDQIDAIATAMLQDAHFAKCVVLAVAKNAIKGYDKESDEADED